MSMTTFGSRLSTCNRVLQKERLLTYGVISPGQSRGISPLQVVAELVLSLLLWVYIENPPIRSARLRLVLPIRRNQIFSVDSDKTEAAYNRLYSDTTEERAVVGLANHGSVLQYWFWRWRNKSTACRSSRRYGFSSWPDHHSTGIRMTPKVPPTFDGQSSWFEFEDLIDDWMGITTLTPERLGPSLKNALVGAAEFYKNMLNNADLRHPENGVRHFKDTLRPYCVKGVNHVFLWRFLQLFRCYRGNQEFVLWIGRFEVTSRRVLTAWMDLFHHDIRKWQQLNSLPYWPLQWDNR